jgi:hypothetical protein
MIERIPNLPNNVLGFVAKGTLTADDYEKIIIPAVESLFSHQDKVRFLLHLGEDFAGIEGAAVHEDFELALKHLNGWERLAVVSDVEWVRAMVRIFGLAMPGHVRVFHNRELIEAMQWVSE